MPKSGTKTQPSETVVDVRWPLLCTTVRRCDRRDPDRHHQASSVRQLLDQRARHPRASRSHDDAGVGRSRWIAGTSIADDHLDLEAKSRQALTCGLSQVWVALDRDHPGACLR